MEAEHVTRRDGEEIKNFLHRIKIVVGKGWPDDLAGVAQNDRNAKRAAQDRQRRQRCIDYSLRSLRHPKLREKAHEYLMDHPNATWEQFAQAVINKDLSLHCNYRPNWGRITRRPTHTRNARRLEGN